MSKAVDQVEQAITAGAYGAAGSSVFLGLTVDEWGIIGVIVGMVLAAGTFAFNIWFKMKYHKDQH